MGGRRRVSGSVVRGDGEGWERIKEEDGSIRKCGVKGKRTEGGR